MTFSTSSTPQLRPMLTSLDPEALSEADHRRLREILTFATDLEHAGDVARQEPAWHRYAKIVKRGVTFSMSGRAELLVMIDRLIVNVRTAVSLFMTGDEATGGPLAGHGKGSFSCNGIGMATDAHFERLRSGRVDTAETSTLHLRRVARPQKRKHALGGRSRPPRFGRQGRATGDESSSRQLVRPQWNRRCMRSPILLGSTRSFRASRSKFPRPSISYECPK